MAINQKKKALLLFGLTAAMVTTSACMPSKIQEKIEETEKINVITKEESSELILPENTVPEDIKISEEEKEVLDKLEKITPEKALAENNLEIRSELNIQLPKKRSIYKDENEFSQFISNLFFKYHTKQIVAADFYKEISPHFDEKFKSLLPESEKEQLRTFEILQEQFLIHLPSPIINYKITNIEIDARTKEGTFYRVYELQNKTKIYYMTFVKPSAEGQWLLLDDKPAPPYKIQDAQEKLDNVK
ncbi:hypothetical protein [Sporosarcina sp. FSL K6-1508]|uniref:hypothetical protein n=1 Tax=Sporosarcina sp. FSL K6-1508 TaxID=2921553 RepID=UPI0030FC04F5